MKSADPVMKETREEDQIIKKLRTTGSIQFAFLTGTFARETKTNIDIFIVGDVNKARLAKVVAGLEEEMGRELNYSSLTNEEYQYRLGLNDRFLTNVLEAKKIVIIDGAERPLAHNDVTFGEHISPEVSVTVLPDGAMSVPIGFRLPPR
jgi:hypothetical protein